MNDNDNDPSFQIIKIFIGLRHDDALLDSYKRRGRGREQKVVVLLRTGQARFLMII